MQKIRFKFLFRFIRGAIGKNYVIKHYGKKILVTKYPTMENIIPSKKQCSQRNLFKEAVAYAQTVILDPVRKASWQKKIKRKNGVYNEAIKTYMRISKNKKEQLLRKADDLINQSSTNIPIEEMDLLLLAISGFHPLKNDRQAKPTIIDKNQIQCQATIRSKQDRIRVDSPIITNSELLKKDLDAKIRISVVEQDNFLLNSPVHLLEMEMKMLSANIQFEYFPGDHFTVSTAEYKKKGFGFMAAKYKE